LLQQLATLEGAGLFHGDLRAWNILVRPDGLATLIDYGSICGECRDRDYPRDWRIPLLILLNQLFRSRDALSWPPKLTDLHPTKLPMPASSLGVETLERLPCRSGAGNKLRASGRTIPVPTLCRQSVSLRESLQIGIDEEMQQLAMRIAALEQPRLTPSRIDFINGAATLLC
jgi:hypothetical protein